MKMEIEAVPRMTIDQFAKLADLTMTCRESVTRIGTASAWTAIFKHTEVMEGGMLVSDSGRGRTMEEAIQDYARKISQKRIATGAYTKDRREFQVPLLIEEEKVKP